MTMQDQNKKQKSLASAILSVANRVDGDKSYIPFSWKILPGKVDTDNRQFRISLVPERDCQGFLFLASDRGKAQLLYEWQAKAKKEVHIPSACDLLWDGKDDSLLILVVVGDSALACEESPVYREAHDSCNNDSDGFSSTKSPVILDASTLSSLY